MITLSVLFLKSEKSKKYRTGKVLIISFHGSFLSRFIIIRMKLFYVGLGYHFMCVGSARFS